MTTDTFRFPDVLKNTLDGIVQRGIDKPVLSMSHNPWSKHWVVKHTYTHIPNEYRSFASKEEAERFIESYGS